jgi:cathepsin B
LLFIVVLLFLNQAPPLNKTSTIDDARIEEHNQNFPWRQGANKFFEGTTLADAKKLISSSFASHSNLVKCNVDDSIVPPESFDTRTQWPKCTLPIGNQQSKNLYFNLETCGSSYAFAAAQTTAERACITSKDQVLVDPSKQELLSCDVANSGCKGGYLNNALDYIRGKGISSEECFPYKADDSVRCDEMCKNPKKQRIENYCILFGEDDIKRDIYKNGPVVATTQIYTDFLTYKSGVYQKNDETPRFSGFTTIKIVGWGVESGTENEPNKGNKYWIVQNSWGEDWGENGYAKISLGQELMFDQYAYSLKLKADKAETVQPTKTTTEKAEEQEKLENLDLDETS